MRRLHLLSLVLALTAAGCSDKRKDPPAGSGTAVATSAPAAPDARAAASGGDAAPAPTVGNALANAATDDGLADHGLGHDRRSLYYARALTAADLDGRTLRDLALMRNTIYARAGHAFRKAWLRDHFTALPWYTPLPKDDDRKVTPVDRANAKLIAAREADFPRDAMVTAQAALAARADRSPDEDVELRLLDEHLGKGAAGGERGPTAAAPKSPLEDPSQLDRLLTLEQLADLSRRDLRILRNTVYARHGRMFKSAALQQWFESKDWYQPEDTFDEASLTSIEKKNVRLIRSVEDSLGGPMSEDEQRAEDGWWDAA